jgi:hypothetical protein
MKRRREVEECRVSSPTEPRAIVDPHP